MKTLMKYYIIVFFLYTAWLPLIAQSIDAGASSYNQMQMLQTRKISVAVTGAVKNPGKYILNATDRADRALQLASQSDLISSEANKIDKVNQGEKSARQIEKIGTDDISKLDLKEKPRRNVLLYRRTGEIIKVDIQKYFATKDERWDPYLFDGDILFVPRFEEKKDIFAVYGGVNVPGQIEYSEGDRIMDAIQLTYGFTRRAIKDSIVLYRYSGDNQSIMENIIHWTQLQKDVEDNAILQPGDRIIVPERDEFREDYHVTISGEVLFPGIYPITRERTKLSTIIHKAGGPTAFASLKSALLYRSDVANKDLQLERMMGIRGNTLIEDTSNFIIENELRLQRGVVNVDFEKLLIDLDTTQDIALRAGDNIVIPSIVKTVYVYGQVVVPGSISFVSNESVDYYVKKAGGYTEQARKSDMMIIKSVTRQWLSPKETKIEEGDCIWIPKVPERSSVYYWTIIGQMASVISVAVSIVLLTIQLNK